MMKRKGVAYILAIMFLAIFSAMAAVYATATGLSLAQGDNQCSAFQARLACESGLEFALWQVRGLRIRQPADTATLAQYLQQALAANLNGTANLGSGQVAVSGATVTIPTITLSGRTFACVFQVQSTAICRLTVTGSANGVSRRAQIDLSMTSKRSGVFDYGLASRGPVSVSGNARLLGVNSPSEASILSATTSQANAITVSGNSTVSGDLSVAGSNTTIAITGSPVIGNTGNSSLWPQHCHFGVTAPDFPLYDTDSLAPLATTTIDSHTNLNGVSSLNNVRIKAGTNPNFSSKMTLNGIIYIEAPNNVSFSGQAVINGMIVTQQASSSQLSNCQISFSGGVEAYGVDALPNTPQFAAVKQQTGTFILAPGFGVTFSGHVSAVNGNIAADQLTFTGTAEGTIKGSVIGLKDVPTSLSGTVDIYVDSKNAVQNPAGFVTTYALVANPDSYVEALPGE
jgi:hypothetical protein